MAGLATFRDGIEEKKRQIQEGRRMAKEEEAAQRSKRAPVSFSKARKTSQSRPTKAEHVEKVVQIAKMIKRNEATRNIRKFCKARYGKVPTYKVLTELRNRTYTGWGCKEAFATMGDAHTRSPEPAVHDVEIANLHKQLEACVVLMRKVSATTARIDAQKAEVKIDINTTMTMNFSGSVA